jgi:hypothetical protein
METYVVILGVGQILTAGLLLYVAYQQGKHSKAIKSLFGSVKALTELGAKSSEIFKLISEWITKKGK